MIERDESIKEFLEKPFTIVMMNHKTVRSMKIYRKDFIIIVSCRPSFHFQLSNPWGHHYPSKQLPPTDDRFEDYTKRHSITVTTPLKSHSMLFSQQLPTQYWAARRFWLHWNHKAFFIEISSIIALATTRYEFKEAKVLYVFGMILLNGSFT